MLDGTDNAAFDTLMRDLALAFPPTMHDVERVRVYWEILKPYAFGEIKARALAYRKRGKKFPPAAELAPEKPATQAKPASVEDPDVVERANKLSHWSRAANLILYHVAYCDRRRGLRPLGRWEPAQHAWDSRPIDLSLLERCLAAKRDLVGAAEQDERAGQPWDEHEFNVTCREAFEKILGLTDVPMPGPNGETLLPLSEAAVA